MKNIFYLYSFLLVGLFNLSSTSWSANADVSEFIKGGYSTESSKKEYNINFKIKVGNLNKENGDITPTEEFLAFVKQGIKVKQERSQQNIAPSTDGRLQFILDKDCINNEIFNNEYLLSTMALKGKCEDSSNGSIRCSNISILYNTYTRAGFISSSVTISCNASIYSIQ